VLIETTKTSETNKSNDEPDIGMEPENEQGKKYSKD